MGLRLSAERLRKVREERGISPSELAKMACIDTSTYYKYEGGAAFPSGPTLRVLSLYLGVSMEYLCGEDDSGNGLVMIPVDGSCAGIVRGLTKLNEEQRKVIEEIVRLFNRS